MATNAGPITLLNCDNLRHNGESLARGLTEFITALNDASLLIWFEQSVSTPNSMVDRITPTYDNALKQRIRQQGIMDDDVPVACEAFSQWVIEDNFIAGRPELEYVGVEFVNDVIPYEEAKIPILNASHSGIAWAGARLGKQSIDESLTSEVRQLIRNYVEQDIKSVLPAGPIDLSQYCLTTPSSF